ncbi:hypothetical protein A9Q81_12850 [Gammaproteobacteria bacterium 42_54_T18]|nr:hypothetical protein A9Q81_12850 [Gammaproteobacteria bacterium 42_54_T18]
MKSLLRIFGLATALMMSVGLASTANAYVIIGNSKFELVEHKNGGWDGAKAHAEASGGQLATFTVAEMATIFAELNPAATEKSYFVGLFQDPNGAEPDSGWEWIDSTIYDPAIWAAGEPNNANGNNNEDWAATAYASVGLNDLGFHGGPNRVGYILETSVSVPEPSSLALLGLGLAGLGFTRRKKA